MTEIRVTSEITVRLIQKCGGDHMVAAAAKVSVNPEEALKLAEEEQKEGISGLINYLIKSRHGSTMEHSSMTFFIHAPIFVWREFHRHRIGFSYNETSGRYKELEPIFYIPPRNRPMIKVENWKPGRPKFMTLDEYAEAGAKCSFCSEGDIDRTVFADKCEYCGSSGKYNPESEYAAIVLDMEDGYEDEYGRYKRQLERNLDTGLARDILPVGIYSSCWVTCNPRSAMHFISLRT